MKYRELIDLVYGQWQELNKTTKTLFSNLNTKEARLLDRFYYWMKKSDGNRVKYRDRMYHPGDWSKDPEEESRWLPNYDAMERIFSAFLQYNIKNKYVA